MKTFTAHKMEAVHVIYLSKGEDVLKSVQKAVWEKGIKSGMVVSGIGALRKARFHYIGTTEDSPTDIIETVDAPIELASVQGMIIEGKPHLHTVFSQKEKTYAGHMEEGCEVQYLAEIAIVEIGDLDAVRKTGPFGIAYLDKADSQGE